MSMRTYKHNFHPGPVLNITGSKIQVNIAYNNFSYLLINKSYPLFQVIIRNIILGEPIEQAVKAPRLHHQLSPMQLQPEADYNKVILVTFPFSRELY